MGRRSTYTSEVGAIICQRVAGGDSAHKIGKDIGGPPTTIYSWADDDNLAPGFPVDYARARLRRGEYYGQLINEIAADTLNGRYDANAARVAIDAYKWTAARMTPKVYGDHASKTLTLNVGEGFSQLLESLDRDVIDITPTRIAADDGDEPAGG